MSGCLVVEICHLRGEKRERGGEREGREEGERGRKREEKRERGGEREGGGRRRG